MAAPASMMAQDAATNKMNDAEGIEFCAEGTTLADAVAKAKAEGKKVFLDCFTSWCGPCKKMAREVFPQKNVGDYMNSRFVSIQIDMEKGEGPALAERLQVSAYPTFIIFNAEGGEIGRFLGGSEADEFLEKVKNASQDDGSAEMDRRWENGERDEAFLLEYIESLGNAYKNKRANEVAQALLDPKASTFASDENLARIFIKNINNPFSEAFIYTAKHPEGLVAVLDSLPVAMKLQSVWRNYVREIVVADDDGLQHVDSAKLESWVALMEECQVENREQLRLELLITADQKTECWTNYIAHIKQYWDNPSLDVTDLSLCRWCTPIVEKCQDKAVRSQACELLRQRLDDLQSGKRQPQTKQGNMIISGNMDKAMTMLIESLEK